MLVPGRWPSTVDQTEVGVVLVLCIVIHLLSDFAGLLVGACVNRAPEGTFGAAVADVGVMDLLKVNLYFHVDISKLGLNTCLVVSQIYHR